MKDNICTYIITHKKIEMENIDGYKVLLVGSDKNNNFVNDYVHDNSGINISGLNDSYCELTGLYWIWKNAKEDIIGLVHYRRLFANLPRHFDFLGRHIVFDGKKRYSFLSVKDIEEELQYADLIVKKSEFRARAVRKIFSRQIGEEMLDDIFKSVSELTPEYVNDLTNLCNSHSHINCNMFIGRRDVVNKYCEWLFPILDFIDDIHVQKYGERYHNREIGYVSELLFGVWLNYNSINYVTAPVVFTEDPMVANGVMNIREFISFLGNRTLKKLRRK